MQSLGVALVTLRIFWLGNIYIYMKSMGQKSYIQRFECFISLHLTGGSLKPMELNSLLPWMDKREKIHSGFDIIYFGQIRKYSAN